MVRKFQRSKHFKYLYLLLQECQSPQEYEFKLSSPGNPQKKKKVFLEAKVDGLNYTVTDAYSQDKHTVFVLACSRVKTCQSVMLLR